MFHSKAARCTAGSTIRSAIMSTVELAGPQLGPQHRGQVHSCAHDKSQQLGFQQGRRAGDTAATARPCLCPLRQANMAMPASRQRGAISGANARDASGRSATTRMPRPRCASAWAKHVRRNRGRAPAIEKRPVRAAGPRRWHRTGRSTSTPQLATRTRSKRKAACARRRRSAAPSQPALHDDRVLRMRR